MEEIYQTESRSVKSGIGAKVSRHAQGFELGSG